MPASVLTCPRILVAGLGGGSGKTIVSLGLARAFTEHGLSVQAFKKGPDYIDAKWLSLASRSDTTNLDPFLLSSDALRNLFWSRARGADLALLEGNRGLYDGKDVEGSCSSAELAKLLNCPVIVVADCTKVTRTMAAIILGLTAFDPLVDIRGVVLNRTAGCRHQNILRDSIEKYTDVKVLGILPKLAENPIPERHMGLISDAEHERDPFAAIAGCLRDNADLDACLAIARSAPAFHGELASLYPTASAGKSVRIGVARDAALWFYYQENFEALRHAGAELVEFSLLEDSAVPDVDAVYMGGGFPETLAQGLAANAAMRESVRGLVHAGMPFYAECGGLMYLSRELLYGGVCYPMSGVFPLTTKVFEKPQGHGYMSSVVSAPNPFYVGSTRLTGHEFHYSRCIDIENVSSFVFKVERGQGMAKGCDGVLFRNCLAGYTHMHALGNPSWAGNFAAAARVYRDARLAGHLCPDIRL
ncbi:cobyrinate a,c-diamide synthase [Desulfomicrobium escambiense]|uniref:cobyrinate a,c-diamide synthase n=1 Tax=Desulfomicrobium escambiense TaxID=29503 RepID=UPI0004015AE9|nr:cobyrinate a,c-diamide synthase [Desulfomicrobium escambiense]